MSHKTKMIEWRGGEMEFATEASWDTICRPPWYVIRLTDPTRWRKPWYYWIDYLGIPQVFLTKRRAQQRAKDLREQFHRCTVEVVTVGV